MNRNYQLPKHWKLYLLDRQRNCCFYCNCFLVPGNTDYDHVVPLCHVGHNNMEMFVASCKACNNVKGAYVHPEPIICIGVGESAELSLKRYVVLLRLDKESGEWERDRLTKWLATLVPIVLG